MRFRKLLVCCCLCCITVAGCASIQANQPEDADGSGREAEVADVPEVENLIHMMAGRADWVFVGTLKSATYYERPVITNQKDPDEPDGQQRRLALFTDLKFEINEMLKGDESQNEIVISQPGGYDAGELFTFSFSYLAKLGDKYVIFAMEPASPESLGGVPWRAAWGNKMGVFKIEEKNSTSYLIDMFDSDFPRPSSNVQEQRVLDDPPNKPITLELLRKIIEETS